MMNVVSAAYRGWKKHDTYRMFASIEMAYTTNVVFAQVEVSPGLSKPDVSLCVLRS